ncbi:MAG: lysophospholipid acyltransferase family protein [Paludibacteraceae bacterium]|nr:lysophospholipid acyltransferase family protein [Paludibacteraceae bacterium]
MQRISKWLLKTAGWKVIVKVDEPVKSIICVAPHTSNWDFPIGKLAYWSLARKASFLIKKSWFFFPIGYIFDAMGGVPVDRSRSTSITQQMAEEFERRSEFHLAITPEGTRSLSPKWKMGFYHIAQMAKIPIQIACLDYEKKEISIEALFYPTGDEAADLTTIQSYYTNAKARFPEKFNLSAQNRQ